MPDFLYPLLSLVLDFVCLLMCIRFIFSKKGAVWIAPCMLTLIFLAGSALCLLAQTSNSVDTTTKIFSKALSIFFLCASFVWLIDIVVFRAVLNPSSIQAIKDRRNLAEALFIKEKTAPKTFWKSGDEAFMPTARRSSMKAVEPKEDTSKETRAVPTHRTDSFVSVCAPHTIKKIDDQD